MTKHWIYFATSEKTSLAATIETIANYQFLWRSAFKANGDLIPNVRAIEPGDQIVVAWRHKGGVRTAYLQCEVARPVAPVGPGLVIDQLAESDAQELIVVGYPKNLQGNVEGIRLDEIRDCYFYIRGNYGGNNALHILAPEDLDQLSSGGCIPPHALNKLDSSRIHKPRLEATLQQAPLSNSTVDRVEFKADDARCAFDAYVMVDWSSSSVPTMGNDSIWIGSGAWFDGTFISGSPQNVSTRLQAVAILREKLLHLRREEKRVLVGMDFAFGYPAGFTKALGLTSASGEAWKSLHEYFDAKIEDSILNVHNRDSFADDCNVRIGAPGPFWGCHKGSVSRSLTQQRIGVFHFPHHGLEEWRVTDLVARKRVTTQSVWKLNCGVSVGGQTILGIKHLNALARSVDGYRWPFEGWELPKRAAICFAEIFPSLIRYPEWEKEYRSRRDRTQVQSCVRYAAERDAQGVLAQDFTRPKLDDSSLLRKLETEEGWILWV